MKLSTVFNYMKDFLSIIEIENKKFHICYNTKTPIKLISDKLIMYFDGINIFNSPWNINHPNYTTLTKNKIELDDIFQN